MFPSETGLIKYACPKCIGGRLFFDLFYQEYYCINCGYRRPVVDFILIRKPQNGTRVKVQVLSSLQVKRGLGLHEIVRRTGLRPQVVKPLITHYRHDGFITDIPTHDFLNNHRNRYYALSPKGWLYLHKANGY